MKLFKNHSPVATFFASLITFFAIIYFSVVVPYQEFLDKNLPEGATSFRAPQEDITVALLPRDPSPNTDILYDYTLLAPKVGESENIVVLYQTSQVERVSTVGVEGYYCYEAKNVCAYLFPFAHFETREIPTFENANRFLLDNERLFVHFEQIKKTFPENKRLQIVFIPEGFSHDDSIHVQEIIGSTKFDKNTLILALSSGIQTFGEHLQNYALQEIISGNISTQTSFITLVRGLGETFGAPFFHILAQDSFPVARYAHSPLTFSSTFTGVLSHVPAKNNDTLPLSGYEYIPHSGENSPKKGSWQGLFFGDSHFTRGFPHWIESGEATFQDYFGCFLPKKQTKFFDGFDTVSINLETSVAFENECTKQQKEIVFQTDPAYLEWFSNIGINTVTLANNHIFDCGQSGKEATKKHLEETGISFMDEENILFYEHDDIHVALLAYDVTLGNFSQEQVLLQIKDVVDSGYIPVVNIHWGEEYTVEANKQQQDIAHALIDAGVRVIIGHHPHVVQNIEKYGDGIIFYSVGNFLFDQGFDDTIYGMGVALRIDEKGITFSPISFERDSKTSYIMCRSFDKK